MVWMPSDRASAAVASPEASSVRITRSTMSCGIASNVRWSVRSALYAGITTAIRRPFSIASWRPVARGLRGFRGLARVLLDVEPVEDSVDDRREHDSRDGENGEARIEGVDAGEELARHGLRNVHRTHAGEDHRGVEECIEPAQRFGPCITAHADGERSADHDEPDGA